MQHPAHKRSLTITAGFQASCFFSQPWPHAPSCRGLCPAAPALAAGAACDRNKLHQDLSQPSTQFLLGNLCSTGREPGTALLLRGGWQCWEATILLLASGEHLPTEHRLSAGTRGIWAGAGSGGTSQALALPLPLHGTSVPVLPCKQVTTLPSWPHCHTYTTFFYL